MPWYNRERFLKQNGYTTACIEKWHLGWDWNTTDGTELNDSVALGRHTKGHIHNHFGDKVDFTKPIENGPVTKGFDYYFGDDVPNFPPYCFIENDKTVGIPEHQKPGNNRAKELGLPEIQLYDLSKDLSEQNNLQDQYPEMVDRLIKLLQKYKDEERSRPNHIPK